ncbi:MAG: AAA family ATPase [Candidatus Dojkabacteria bacterium]|jgi:ATP-dependent Lon protease|nr:AAA family ATPase [Candidatus Dojkabacteria bacterium]MDD4560958.1 AAA family ATPase [Candidatus Dojkabacteria bacterium]HQA99055.1 AAA family ATPase [Candidatus Dojkabacteria bacterium]
MDYSNQNRNNTNIVTDEGLKEVLQLENKLVSSRVPDALKEESMRSVNRLKRMFQMGAYSAEFENVNKYIDWVTRIPWGVLSEDRLDISNAKKIMDGTHYGMDVIKELILDYLATMQLEREGGVRGRNLPSQVPISSNGEINRIQEIGVLKGSSSNAPVFLFVGLQGVGKTSIAKSIAISMGRKFARVSLGAIGDVRTIRGTPRYSIDAEPGQIVKALINCGTMNPVILLDEIEKSSGNSGLLNDVMAALLEILDPEQNHAFTDHYIDYPIDLSNVFFVCTANNLGGLSAALLDRVEVIRFTSYSDQEKEVIGKQYLLPKVLKNLNISTEYIQIQEDVWPLIIRPVGFDAGIRQLERNITTIVRSAARKIIEGERLPIVIDSSNLREYVLADQGPLS